MKAKNAAAVKLGRLGRGKPKKLSHEERKRRAEIMKQNQAKRWVKPKAAPADFSARSIADEAQRDSQCPSSSS